MRVTPTTGGSPFEVAGVEPEQRGPALTDGQATVLRTLLETYAAEFGQAPRWRDALSVAWIAGVPIAEIEPLRSVFPDDNLSRPDGLR